MCSSSMPMRILTVTGTPPGRGRDGRAHDRCEQPPLVGQRRAAALAGDLGDRAAEVQVDVVGQVLLDDDPHRPPDRRRVDAVELQRARVLVGVERDHLAGLRVALDQRRGS